MIRVGSGAGPGPVSTITVHPVDRSGLGTHLLQRVADTLAAVGRKGSPILAVVLITGALSACTPEGLIVENHTDQAVRILRTRDNSVLVADIAAHDTRRVGLSVGSDGCTPDIGYSAYAPDGDLIASLGRVCRGDTWRIK